MEFEDALKIINLHLNRKISRSLIEIEVLLVFGAWNNLTYDQIAQRSGYSINYLQRDIGPKFWKLLSNIFGYRINKTNLRGILNHFNCLLPNSQNLEQTSVDWGEAIDVSNFYGRTEEIKKLTQWIIQDHCRLIALLGMGGIGKSTLASKIAQLLQGQFQFVIWRSLRNSPPLEKLLSELVPFVSNYQDTQAKAERLLYWLQTRRCLVILDNQETLLQVENYAGCYKPNFINYGELFKLLGESNHQSCIIITSREKSIEISTCESLNGRIRSLSLQGCRQASLAFINSTELIGNDKEKHLLCEIYRYNPLKLKIISASIQNLFDGNIATFLQTEIRVFYGIRRLLDEQFERLSSLEQTIMYELAINREWMTISELQAGITPTVSQTNLLESLESLTWRNLIEQKSGKYTQQLIIMEYVMDRLNQELKLSKQIVNDYS